MEERPIITVEHIIDAHVENRRWGVIEIKKAKTYRVELGSFEPIFDYLEIFKKFEELVNFYDTHQKSRLKHVKILAYGKDLKDNVIIALVLIEEGGRYGIIAYNINKSIEELERIKYNIEWLGKMGLNQH